MTLKLKPSEPTSPFSWENLRPPSSPDSDPGPASLPSSPTSRLSARDMKLFGAQPLTSTSDIGLVKSFYAAFFPHRYSLVTCATVRSGGKNPTKGKPGIEKEDPKSKKRKASPSPSDPSVAPKKKFKPTTKVAKGRMKGSVDYDQECGIINDENMSVYLGRNSTTP
ncbi:hypothetical protein FB451DRAFT_1189869 [Mycena latifolia]|nr:hypothetical protein FB451DRAFT_1189869 [Mycena latifolia]